MEQFLHNIKIYKFDGLTKLMGCKYNYDDYLVVLDTKERKTEDGKPFKIWYQIEEKELIPNYTGYFKEKFGFSTEESEAILNYYNSVVRTKSYDKLTMKKLSKKKTSNYAKTDEGIILYNYCLGSGRLWCYRNEKVI